MRSRVLLRIARRLSLSSLSLSFIFCLPTLAQDRAFEPDLQAWRQHYLAELTKPDGWLSLAGLEWLNAGDNTFGSAADNRIHLPAAAPAHLGILRLDGQP